MLNNILHKIGPYLGRPFQSEGEIVYVMAEIRKVLEHHKESGLPTFAVLNLFCNWALHTAIFKDPVNIKIYLSAYDAKPGMTEEDYLKSKVFKDILNLTILRAELSKFLSLHNLPTETTDNSEMWSNFVHLYTGVVSEVPMRYIKNDLLPDDVEELTLHRIDYGEGLQPFAKWFIKLKNGQTVTEDILYREAARN
jgi:hypothetical protein